MINVLVVEDSSVFLMGLKLALSSESDFSSVESVSTPGAAVTFLNSHPETDVVVVDISLESETDGLMLLNVLCEAFPHVRTMVLSHYKNPEYILKAITSGARAYIAKDSSAKSIVAAVSDVASDKMFFFGETIDQSKIIGFFGGKKNLEIRKPHGLTQRELDFLQLVTSGYSNTQISSVMKISLNTVDSYKERIKDKFGMDTMVECVAKAVEDGLVSTKKVFIQGYGTL